MTLQPKHLVSTLLIGILIGLAWPRHRSEPQPLPAQAERDSVRVISVQRDTITQTRIEYRTRFQAMRDTLPCPEALAMADTLLRLTELELMQTRQIERLQAAIITRTDTMYLRAVEDAARSEKSSKRWKIAAGVGWAVAVALIVAR